jgi:hypothetical protein
MQNQVSTVATAAPMTTGTKPASTSHRSRDPHTIGAALSNGT